MNTEVNNVVSQLLLSTNCVVIPGLGGFVANPIAAKVDYARGIITPPTKALTFNIKLTNNDGLLVNEVAKINKLDYENALSSVMQFSKQSNQLLSKGERVTFPNVGFLFLNEAGKITFEQDRFFNLLLSSYGLGQVEFVPEKIIKPVTEKSIEEEATEATPLKVDLKTKKTKADSKENTPSESPIIELKPTKKDAIATNEATKGSSTFKKVMRYAAIAALAPMAFYSFWIPMNTDVLQSGIVYKEDFNPFTKKTSERYLKTTIKDLEVTPTEEYKSLDHIVTNLPKEVTTYSFGLTDDIFIPVRIREENEKKEYNKQEITAKKTTKKHTIAPPTKGKKAYYLIAGAFGEQKNATRFVEKLKQDGFNDAHIVDQHKGLHRVAIASFNSRKEAKLHHSTLKDKNISNWILSH